MSTTTTDTLNYTPTPSEWDKHASCWQTLVQDLTLAPCTELLKAVDAVVPFATPSARVLDNGTGGGMLTSLLKNMHPSIPITASDLSPGMLETVRETANKAGWKDVETRVLDAQRLDGLSDAEFSHVVCSFVVSFVPDPAMAIREMYRVTRPNGVLGLGTWSRVSWMEPWEKARRTVQPGYKAPSFLHPRTTEKEDVRALLEEAGYRDVKVWDAEARHPMFQNPDMAVELFYTINNPCVLLLRDGLSEEELERTKEPMKRELARFYVGGRKTQFEVAILATGIKG